MQKNLPVQFRAYIQNFLVGVVLFVIFFVSVRVLITTILTIPTRWAQLQTVSAQEALLRTKQQLLTAYNPTDLQNMVGQSRIALPEQKESGSVLAGISAVAAGAQVIIKDLTLTPGLISSASGQQADTQETEKFPQGHHGQLFRLIVRGELGQINQFLQALTHSRRLFGIASIEFRFSPDLQVDASIVGDAYFSPPLSVQFDPAAPLEDITAQERTVLGVVGQFPIVSAVTATGSGNFDRSDLFIAQ